jgi:hypothetical protein
MHSNIRFVFLCLCCLLFYIIPYEKRIQTVSLEKIDLITIVLEILGATGLMVGLIFKPILTISSLGLALLMLFGIIVRIKLKDSIWISLSALFFMGLNTYII